MKRKLGMLGLALVAVLAMSGVMAQLAQAGSFEAESYPVTIAGSQTEGKHIFKTVASELYCNKVSVQSPPHAGTITTTSRELCLRPLAELARREPWRQAPRPGRRRASGPAGGR